MQEIDTYLREGWDFVDEILNGTCDYWQISTGEYPRLQYHTGNSPAMPAGLGTAEQPYLIRDANDLGTVWSRPTAHYRLEADLDLSGIKWPMAVVPWFRGTFNGNGHVISNLHIQGDGFLGLFGQLRGEAEISSLGLDAVDVIGTGDNVGGLVGSNTGSITSCYSTGLVGGTSRVGGLVGDDGGSITNCYSTGSVSGNWVVGSLVGWNWGGSITECYSTGAVSGNGDVGSLVGWNGFYGSITDCYSTGTVTGDYNVGGLVGSNDGRITTSYNTGLVTGNEEVGGLVGTNADGLITSSFWDKETSGQTTSDGGEGMGTAEMQRATTFLDAGWDFIDETENGTEDIWWIDEGQDYPRLWWEGLE
jgi:hypothetical protein